MGDTSPQSTVFLIYFLNLHVRSENPADALPTLLRAIDDRIQLVTPSPFRPNPFMPAALLVPILALASLLVRSDLPFGSSTRFVLANRLLRLYARNLRLKVHRLWSRDDHADGNGISRNRRNRHSLLRSRRHLRRRRSNRRRSLSRRQWIRGRGGCGGGRAGCP